MIFSAPELDGGPKGLNTWAMRPWSLAVVAVLAAAPARAVWLGERVAAEAETADVVALNAEITVSNYHALEDAFLDAAADEKARARATELVKTESAALDELIPKLKAAVARKAPRRAFKVPAGFAVSYARFADDADAAWPLARDRANTASALSYLYRSRGAKSAAVRKERAKARQVLSRLKKPEKQDS